MCILTTGDSDVDVRQVVAPAPSRDVIEENGQRTVISLVTGGWLVLDRPEGTAVFHVPVPIGPEELIHPYLVPAAAAFCSWAGREAYHAGAFVIDGRAWAVVGDKESGKTTTLAALAQLGVPVLSDDLLVLDDRTVLQGPRLVDLREPSAIAMGLGRPVESAREGGRWRTHLPWTSDAELAGWVFLRWGDRVGTRQVSLAERVARLIGLGPTRAEAVLSLASLPGYELVRPRDLASLAGAVERLLLDVGGGALLG